VSALPQPDLNISFRLGRKLGDGGQGSVFLATQHGRHFAFKVLPQGEQGGSRDVEKAVCLEHVAVAKIFGYGRGDFETGGSARGVVSEFVDGFNLQEILRNRLRRTLEPGELWPLAEAYAAGIDYSHKQLVHRDLKPQNLMIRRWDWAPKIVDFGLASHIADDGSEATSESLGGTLLYMSPEIMHHAF
jgi:serine/threonine-protein kinase